MQLSTSHDDFGLLTDLSGWDQGFLQTQLELDGASHFDLDPIRLPHTSAFPTPELEFETYAPCLDFSAPLFDLFPPLPSTSTSTSNQSPVSGFITPAITTTPVTTTIQTPFPTPPSSDDSQPADPSLLVPGLKLPQPKQSSNSSRPGRRPASTGVLDGRITKSSGSTTTPPDRDRDADPEIISRRQRNNLAAKRYRQKKIDRIEELEEQVKEVTQERDELRIKLARQEAEVAALREMLKLGEKKGDE